VASARGGGRCSGRGAAAVRAVVDAAYTDAKEGRLVTPRGPFADGVVLTNLPVVLPRESLV